MTSGETAAARPRPGDRPEDRAARGGRDFRLFWYGETVSLYGTQVTFFVLPATALTLGATAGQMGLLRSAELAPYVFALLAGVAVDRLSARPLMIVANLLRLLLIGMLPVLAWRGDLRMSLLLPVAVAVGTASVVYDVAWMSFVPELVGPDQLVEANSRLGVSASSAQAAGPGLGGLLVAVVRAPYALAVDAASYLFSLVTLALIRTAPRSRPDGAPPSSAGAVLRQLVEGIGYVACEPRLRALAVIGFATNLVITGHSSMVLLYATQNGVPASWVGLMLSVSAIAGALGAVLSRRLVERFGPGRLYRWAFALVLCAPVLIPLAGGPGPVFLVVLGLAYGPSFLAMGIGNVVVMSLRQRITPQPLLGRMNAAMRTLLFGGGALGGAATGALADAVGLRPGLAVLAAASVLAVPAVLLSPVSRLRGMPEPAWLTPAPDAPAAENRPGEARRTSGPGH
ncbi:MAG TPA: MFS transporter [Kineosporiaceae bacterium]